MKKNYFLLLIVLGFYSCKKETPNEVVNNPEVDVYVSGFVADHPAASAYNWGYDEHPTYWKNGSPVELVYGDLKYTDNKSGRARAIAVSGNNVYVVGYGTWLSYTRGTIPYGVLWINGIPADPDSMNIFNTNGLSSLAISNNDIYMLGWGRYNYATYWKNVNPVILSNGPEFSETSSIAISGNDVYVAGISFNSNYYYGGYNRMAKYWKNGNPVNLTDGTKDAFTSSITVSGTDVFVAGVEDSVAKYWKNGNPVNLTGGLKSAEATSIAVSGNDVYVAGHENGVAKYWKNGTLVDLTDGSTWAEANAIAVSGTDVYVAGFEGGVAKYWKNGIPVILGGAAIYSEAYSIFLVKK